VLHFNGISPENWFLGGGITQGSFGVPAKRLSQLRYFHSPCLHCVSRNKLLFEGNKSRILVVLVCAASGAELQLEPFELFSEIVDLPIAMRPVHHRGRSSRAIDSISKSWN